MREILKPNSNIYVFLKDIPYNATLVGLFNQPTKGDHVRILLFTCYNSGCTYTVNTFMDGLINNAAEFSKVFTTQGEMRRWMVENCEKVFIIESYKDLADIITTYNPSLFF